jgi:hypothetical protein
MANNVTKYIDITGDKMSMKVIELACILSFSERKQSEEAELTSLSRAFGYMDCDIKCVTEHGWAEIIDIQLTAPISPNHSAMLSIGTLTPNGNLQDAMTELRKQFPKCDFHCFNDQEVENEID